MSVSMASMRMTCWSRAAVRQGPSSASYWIVVEGEGVVVRGRCGGRSAAFDDRDAGPGAVGEQDAAGGGDLAEAVAEVGVVGDTGGEQGGEARHLAGWRIGHGVLPF